LVYRLSEVTYSGVDRSGYALTSDGFAQGLSEVINFRLTARARLCPSHILQRPLRRLHRRLHSPELAPARHRRLLAPARPPARRNALPRSPGLLSARSSASTTACSPRAGCSLHRRPLAARPLARPRTRKLAARPPRLLGRRPLAPPSPARPLACPSARPPPRRRVLSRPTSRRLRSAPPATRPARLRQSLSSLQVTTSEYLYYIFYIKYANFRELTVFKP
jgi:hypothetical protein